jgi:hemolysin III
VAVYVMCALAMFGISTLYHRVNWSPENRLLWKKLDHSAIYLMIAGTFTPICALILSDGSGVKLLITIWSVAFIGILQSIFFVNIPKMVSSVIYLVAGYLVLPYLGEINARLGTMNTALIITGGVLYSVGALCYGLKRPLLNPKVFSYHEVFHLFVNFGAAAHYLVISKML